MYYRSEIALEHVNSRREGYRRMSGGVKTSLCLRDFSVLKRSLLLLRKWINSIHLLIPYGAVHSFFSPPPSLRSSPPIFPLYLCAANLCTDAFLAQKKCTDAFLAQKKCTDAFLAQKKCTDAFLTQKKCTFSHRDKKG